MYIYKKSRSTVLKEKEHRMTQNFIKDQKKFKYGAAHLKVIFINKGIIFHLTKGSLALLSTFFYSCNLLIIFRLENVLLMLEYGSCISLPQTKVHSTAFNVS